MLPSQKQLKTKARNLLWFFTVALAVSAGAACSEIQRPQAEPFYAETRPPAKQQLRWSNGRSPRTFDPARAASAPETDIVRAIFAGLTEIDPKTLKAIPAVAAAWTSSDDLRTWTFHLREDARWSNGKRVTANDFVRSWKRLRRLGEKAAYPELFENIVGLGRRDIASQRKFDAAGDEKLSAGAQLDTNELPVPTVQTLVRSHPTPMATIEEFARIDPRRGKTSDTIGFEAVDDLTFQVRLGFPDKDFPKLVANPIFRPIHGDGSEFAADAMDADIVTNGPFTVASVSKDHIALDRSDSYWNKAAVNLERVEFVFKESAEEALSAYKKGEIDVLTNAEFAPLALKILSPYDDFHQTTHSTVNLFEVNTRNPPFSDPRVREALAISIDRERLTQIELEGAARPALSFLALSENRTSSLTLDLPKARLLLAGAGFEDGIGFPKIRLLINRNDTQQRVARAVTRMWKQNLNLDAEIIVKELSEMDTLRSNGEYDLMRRGVVLPTVDEAVALEMISGTYEASPFDMPLPSATTTDRHLEAELKHGGQAFENAQTEERALEELTAIPLYFPMAYSLVKPYVKGFDVNGLDAAALDHVSIDSNWKPGTSH